MPHELLVTLRQKTRIRNAFRNALVRKKGKQIFQIRKGFTTCSKLVVIELEYCLTRSENVYFANNKQA